MDYRQGIWDLDSVLSIDRGSGGGLHCIFSNDLYINMSLYIT